MVDAPSLLEAQATCATLEPDEIRHKQRTFSDADREAVKALSIAGLSDNAILERFPGLQGFTLRKWRERDAVWAAAFVATRKPVVLPPTQMQKASQTVTQVAGASLAEIHSKTALSLATATATALGAFAANPAPVENWSDASVAYKLQRLACGIDKEGGGQVVLNLSMFTEEKPDEREVNWEAEGGVVETGDEMEDETIV